VKTAQLLVKEINKAALASMMDAVNQFVNHASVARQVAAVLMANAFAQINKRAVHDLYRFTNMYSE